MCIFYNLFNIDVIYCRADLYQDECVQQVLSYRPDWEDEYKQFKAGDNPENIGRVPNCFLEF